MNDELGGIMTYKLKAEDAVRSAGVPFVVVLPTALTEEPAGAPLEFDQGEDNESHRDAKPGDFVMYITIACLVSGTDLQVNSGSHQASEHRSHLLEMNSKFQLTG